MCLVCVDVSSSGRSERVVTALSADKRGDAWMCVCVPADIHTSMHFRTFRIAEFVTRLSLLEDRPKARQRCVFKHILPHFRKTHRDGNPSPPHECPGAGPVTDIADKSRYKYQNEDRQHQ